VPYFDSTDSEHKKLLPEGIRSDSDLANVAAESEADVISHYTAPADDTDLHTSYYSINTRTCTELTDDNGDSTGLFVWLRGYTEDPADCTNARFAAAMRSAIAAVIAWRHYQRERNPLHATEAGDAGTFSGFSYRQDAGNPFPPAFERHLQNYDTRRPLEVL